MEGERSEGGRFTWEEVPEHPLHRLHTILCIPLLESPLYVLLLGLNDSLNSNRHRNVMERDFQIAKAAREKKGFTGSNQSEGGNSGPRGVHTALPCDMRGRAVDEESRVVCY